MDLKDKEKKKVINVEKVEKMEPKHYVLEIHDSISGQKTIIPNVIKSEDKIKWEK